MRKACQNGLQNPPIHIRLEHGRGGGLRANLEERFRDTPAGLVLLIVSVKASELGLRAGQNG